MAKKATTGVPSRRTRTADQEQRRTYLSRAEREARVQRWVLLGTGGALAVVLIVLLVGIAWDGIIYPNQPVAIVNGQTITTTAFQARVRFARWQLGQQLLNVARLYGAEALTDQSSPFYNQYVQLQPGMEYLMGDQVLNDMIEGILIRQEAAERGITVDAAQIDEQVQSFFGYNPNPQTPTPTIEPSVTPTPIVSPTPSPTPTASPTPEVTPSPSPTPVATATPVPTLTAEERSARYDAIQTAFFDEGVSISGLSWDDIRAIFEVDALRKLLYEEVTGDMSRIEEQVSARHIQVDTEQAAEDVMAALAEGESFTDLARYASSDSSSARQGGELGWTGPGGFVERFGQEFEDTLFNGEIGVLIGPVTSQAGQHIIQIHAREERELTDLQYQNKRETTFSDWLSGLRTEADPNIEMFDYSGRVPTDPTIYDLGLAISSSGSQ